MKVNVVCVQTFNNSFITIGKKYIVTEIIAIHNFYDVAAATYYTILNDNNQSISYESGCFKNIKDDRRKKLNNLNSL
jgi:hypothetical protein